MSLEIQSVERVDWTDELLEDPARLEEALSRLGLSQDKVREARASLERQLAEVQSSLPPEQRHLPLPYRGTLSESWARLKRWVRALLVEVGIRPLLEYEPLEIPVEIPLFLLGAPDTPRAEVAYERKALTEGRHDWKVTFFGSGFSAKQSVSASASSTILASAGTTKLIYLPAIFLVKKMGVFEGEGLSPVRMFLQVELKPPALQGVNGLRSLPREEALHLMGSTRKVGEYPMRNSPAGDLHTFEYRLKLSGDYSLELGFKAFDTEIKQTIAIKMEQESAIKLKLPEGHDYELLTSDRLAGVVCGVVARKR